MDNNNTMDPMPSPFSFSEFALATGSFTRDEGSC